MDQFQVSMNVDSSGFMSQQCPACDRRFKIQPGKGSPNPIAHCPFCRHAGLDCWWTTEQAEYIEGIAEREVVAPLLADLDASMRRLGDVPGVSVTIDHEPASEGAPMPLEADGDMPAHTEFACCGETIRHATNTVPVICIICGNEPKHE